MQKILTDNIWQQISHLTQKAKRKIAALAYVSSPSYLSFRKGDLLICDASDQAIRSGETSATVLEQFFKAGAEIYSCPCLHAKALIFDRTALIGSCNLSQSSAEVLRELALLTSDTSTRSQILAYIHSIKDSSLPVDEAFLKRILKIPVSKRKGLQRTKRKHIHLGTRTWIVRTYRMNPERYNLNFAPKPPFFYAAFFMQKIFCMAGWQ
jgi:phosphatidylserine/phosphatidylglycerophosphate/cardiolipin synthase-like enzyme